MANPIKPTHSNESSLLNQYMSEGTEQVKVADIFTSLKKEALTIRKDMIDNLLAIHHEDNITTASNAKDGIIEYKVPPTISDYDLLGLKTYGLIVGKDRVVTLSEKAKTALCNSGLSSNNVLKEARQKEKFDLLATLKTFEPGRYRTAGKFNRIKPG